MHVRSSNLIRSLDTCRLALEMLPRKDLLNRFGIDHRLREMGFGIWENTPLSSDIKTEDLQILYMCLMKGQIKPFNGDDVNIFETNMKDAFNEALPGGLNLYFTHSGVIYTAMRHIDETFFIGQCGIAAFEFDDFYKEKRLIGVFDGVHEKFI